MEGEVFPGKGASPPVSAVCSNLPARPRSPSLSGIVDSSEPEPVPLDPEISAPVPMKKTTVNKFSPRSRLSGASKQSSAGLFHQLEADLGEAAGGDKNDHMSASPSTHSTAIKTPVLTARKS